MKIKATSQQSIASQLVDILYTSLPSFKITGLSKDLQTVKADAKSKGKAVLFVWRKNTYRLTEALKVTEFDFTNSYVENEGSKEVEAIIKASLSTSTPSTAPAEATKELVNA